MIKARPKPKSVSAPEYTKAGQAPSDLNPSVTVRVYDIPIDHIVLSDENPNEQDDKTFDLLVQSIKDNGFTQPVQVVPYGNATDAKFKVVAGEHRYKACKLLGFKYVPCIVHQDWDDLKRKIELVKDNQLKGNLNPEKFTKLFNELATAGVDKELLKAQMGFTKSDAFEKVYKSVEKNMTPKQKKQLAEAKEEIKSVDDLSSVLNTIFKESGSELEEGYMVFSFGGKNHHYFKIDGELDSFLSDFEESVTDSGEDMKLALKRLFKKGADRVTLPVKVKPKPKVTNAKEAKA